MHGDILVTERFEFMCTFAVALGEGNRLVFARWPQILVGGDALAGGGAATGREAFSFSSLRVTVMDGELRGRLLRIVFVKTTRYLRRFVSL